VFYATWGMLAFVLTLGKAAQAARTWAFTGLIVMLICEVTLLTTEDALPSWFFPTTTEHEWIWLLHSLFPGFMNGCRSIGSHLYVDVDKETRDLLRALSEQNKDTLLVLRDVQIKVSNIEQNGGGRGGGAHAGAAAAAAGAADGAAAPMPRALPTGKLKELESRLRSSPASVSPAVGALKAEGSKGGGNMGFYLMIAAYIVVQFVFSS
jgi:hypothetical protein